MWAVIASGLLAVSATQAQELKDQKAPATNAAPPAFKPMDRTDAMGKTLGLTDEQKTKARPILEAETKAMMELRNDKSASAADRQTKFRTLRLDTLEKLKPILTPDQYERYGRALKGRPAPGAPGAPAAPAVPAAPAK